MDRRSRSTIVITVAVATAGLASFGVYRAIKQIPVREVEVAHLYVVAANEPLVTGTLIENAHLKVIAWPQRNPIAGAFTNKGDVVGRGLIASVLENEPITEGKLAPKEAGAGLPPSIPAGMRAMSVQVNEVVGVAGFAVPGTYVDVLATVRGEGRDDGTMARVVVTNVQVLTAGTRYDQEKSRDGQPIPTTVVTLMVTPQDAERIALATTEGKIMLTLRNPLDRLPTQTPGVRMAALMGPATPPPVPKPVQRGKVVVAAKPAPAPTPSVYTVEAIRAAKRAEEVVR